MAIVPEEPLHSISGTCVLWSDKTKPELFQHIDFVYAWWRKGKAFNNKSTIPTVKQGGGSVRHAVGRFCSLSFSIGLRICGKCLKWMSMQNHVIWTSWNNLQWKNRPKLLRRRVSTLQRTTLRGCCQLWLRKGTLLTLYGQEANHFGHVNFTFSGSAQCSHKISKSNSVNILSLIFWKQINYKHLLVVISRKESRVSSDFTRWANNLASTVYKCQMWERLDSKAKSYIHK